MAKKSKASTTANKRTYTYNSGMSAQEAHSFFTSVQSGIGKLRQNKTAQEEYEEYLRQKQTESINNVASPNMADDSMASYAQYKNTKGAQLATYDSLADDIRSDIENIRDTKNDEKILGVFQNPFATGAKNLEDEFKTKYGVSDDTLNQVLKVSNDAATRDEFNNQFGDGKYEQARNDYNAKNYTRTYDEEIDYAKDKFSTAAPNVNELRADIKNYNNTSSQKANDYFERPTLRESIKSLMSGENANDLKSQIMNKYNLTDEEFEDLAYYGKELDDYDDRMQQQADAKAAVNTGDTKKDVAGGILNSATALLANPTAGINGLTETAKYNASRLLGTAYDRHSPLNVNSAAFDNSNTVTDLQGATQERISNWNTLAGLGYAGAMSAAESFETGMLAPAGAVGGAAVAAKLGMGAKTIKNAAKVGQTVAGLAPFAANAFTNSLSENVSAGEEMDEALTQAMIDTGIEVGTEIVSFDKFWDIAQGNSKVARKVLVNFLVQSGIEGTEEAIGDVADLIIDNIRHGENSDFNENVRAYMENNNMSEEDAVRQARRDFVLQTAEDFVTGAISGALGGIGATAINISSSYTAAQDFFSNYTPEQYAEFAESIDLGDDGYFTSKTARDSAVEAKDLAEKYSKQGSVSPREKAKLFEAWQDATSVQEEVNQEAADEADEKRVKKERENKKTALAVQEEEPVTEGKQVFAGKPSSGGEAVFENGVPVVTNDFAEYARKENVASNKQIQEAIPDYAKTETNNSTPEEIHKEMASATNLEALEAAVLKGSASTNAKTREQVWTSLDWMSDKYKASGITEEELDSLKRGDADLYRAGYNGTGVKAYTNHQRLIVNAATKDNLNAKAARNTEQTRINNAYVESIKDASLKNIASSNWQAGFHADSYKSVLDGVANAQRTGMSEEEAWKSVKVFANAVGASDLGVVRAAAKATYNRSVDIFKDEARRELDRSLHSQKAVKSFGTGSFEDIRSDKSDAIDGADVIRNFANLTGLDLVVFDKGNTDKNSAYYDERVASAMFDEEGNYKTGTNGWYRASDSTIYLNADQYTHLAGTLAHELGEFTSVWSPSEYQAVVQALQNAVIKKIGIHKYNEFRDSYKHSYAGEKKKTDVDIDKEMANDLIYQFLASENSMRSFINELTGGMSDAQKKTVLQKLSDWLHNLKESLKQFFNTFNANDYQRAAVRAQISGIEGLEEMVHKALADAVKNYQSAQEDKTATKAETKADDRSSLQITDVNDKRLADAFNPNDKTPYVLPNNMGYVDEDGILRFSETTYKKDGGTRDFLEKWLNSDDCKLSRADKKDLLARMDFAYELAKSINKDMYTYYSNWSEQDLVVNDSGVPLIEVRKNDGSPIRSVVVKNDEYPLNIDFSQICKKRVAFNAVINKLVEKYGINLPTLTASDYNYINKEIRDAGYEIACGMCFVESRRYRVGKWAEDFTGDYEKPTKDAKTGYNGLLRLMKAKDGKPVGYSYFNYTVKADPIFPNGQTTRTINDLSENEIDKSALAEKIGKFAIKDDNGNIVGLKNKVGRNAPTEEVRMAWLLYNDRGERHLISNEEIISSNGLEYIRSHNKDLYALVNMHGGASKAKAPLTQTAYGSEIMRSIGWGEFNFTPESAAKVGGVRIQSFSDYEANMFFDYMQLFADMEARGLTAHSYSKEWAYARLFGLTGAKINMSIIPKAISDTNKSALGKTIESYYKKHKNSRDALMNSEYGDYAKYAGINIDTVKDWIAKNNLGDIDIGDAAVQMVREGISVKDVLLHQENETFDLDKALAIQNEAGYSNNCGLIWIAISDAQMRVLLESDEVPMVIPYHSSNINPAVKLARDLYLYRDYQPVQNTMYGEKYGKDKVGKKIESADFDFYESLARTNDPVAAVEEYKAWCDKNGYIPKFGGKDWKTNKNDFTNHPNYYKTIIDFKVYDYNGTDAQKVAGRRYLKQMPVKLVLPDNAKAIVEESLAAQQETMGNLQSDVGADNGALIGRIAEHFKDRALANADDRMSLTIPQVDSEGTPLSVEQREFFAKSKALDDDGRLKLMYHGSQTAGFTIFDPTMSDDGISLFFTDNENVAASYSGQYNRVNPYESQGPDGGNYSVYLNLENPLEVDADGYHWNEVPIHRADIAKTANTLEAELKKITNGAADAGKVDLWNVIKERGKYYGAMKFSEAIERVVEEEYGVGTEYDSETINALGDKLDKTLELGTLGVGNMDGTSTIYMALTEGSFKMTTRQIAAYARRNGYDGVIFKDIVDIGPMNKRAETPSTVMVAFKSNQVKDAENLTPTENDDIRFSREIKDVSNTGEPVSEGQKEYFAKTVLKTRDGNLVEMYHGTPIGGFHEYKTKSGAYFFATRFDVAATYASHNILATADKTLLYAPTKQNSDSKVRPAVYRAYLNVTNPIVVNAEGKQYFKLKFHSDELAAKAGAVLKTFLDEYHDSGVTMDGIKSYIDQYGTLGDALAAYAYELGKAPSAEVVGLADGVDQYLKKYDINITADEVFRGDGVTDTDHYARYAKDNGNDGLIVTNVQDGGPWINGRQPLSTVAIVFNSNQIKSVRNTEPTVSPDIRESINIGEARNNNDADIEDNQYEVASILEAGAELLKDAKVNKALCRSIAIEMKQKYNSAYDVDDLTNKLSAAFAYLQSGSNVNHADFVAVMDEIARLVVDEAYTPASAREDFANFKNKIDGMKFSISKEQAAAIRSAFGSRAVFNKYFPEIHIDENAPSLDSQWADIVDASGYLVDEYTDHGDMVIALAQAFEDLRPTVGFEDATQMAHDMSLDIIARYLGNYHASGATKSVINEYTKKAVSDIKTAQSEWKKQAEIKYAQRLAEEREYQKDLATERRDKQKGRTAEQIAKLKAKNKERITDLRDRQKKRAQIAQIEKTADTLYQYLANPTDEKHIHRDLQEPVFELLQALDMSTPTPKLSDEGKWYVKIFAGWTTDENGRYKYNWKTISADTREEVFEKYYKALSEGYGGKSARKWYDRMQDMAGLFNKKGDEVYDTKNSIDMADFLQALDSDLSAPFKAILDSAGKKGKTSINDLSLDELKTLNAVLKNVLHAVNYINRSYSLPSETVTGIAGDVMGHADAVNGRKNRSRKREALVDFFSLTNANPHTYLHAIGADKAIDILIKAQNDKAFKLRQAQEHSQKFLSEYSKAEIRGWDKEQSYLDGRVVATKAQIMTIYELLQRPDATLHLLEGGFKIGSIGDKTTTQNKVIRLSLDEYNALIDEALDERDKKAADAMQQFMANECAAWGNETSMLMYGYEKFKDERYWPMKVLGSTVNTKMSEMMGGVANTIKNMGMTKATVSGASNPLLIDGALDVYAKHISDMAVYSAWTAPIQDLVRFFNFRERDENGQVTRSTKDAIETMFGTGGTQYFIKLMSSIQGTEQSSFEDGGLTNNFLGKAKKAAVMANVRVAVQQPTAILRAGKRIDYKYLTAGVAGLTGNLETIRKDMIGSDAVYWIKQQGNIDGFITQSIKTQITGVQTPDEAITEKAGWLAGMADQVTWDAMYRACIAEQIDKMGKDKVGTKEFETAVNNRFDHLMLETQVYDGTITRTQFMRSTDMAMKNASAFMAEPAKTYNIVLSDVIDYQQSKKGSEERKEASRQIRKTARVLLFTASVNAFMQSLWDAVRNAGDPDEQEKTFWQRVAEALGWDFDAETPTDQAYAFLHGNLMDGIYIWNNVPLLSDMTEQADAQLSKIFFDKSSYSSNTSLDSQWLTHLGDFASALKKMATDPDNNEVSAYGIIAKGARVFSDLTGLPAYAFQRDAAAIYNQLGGRALGLPMLQTKKTSNKKQSKIDVYDTIRESTDLDEVKAAIDEAVNKGYTYDAIGDDLKKNLSSDLAAMSSSDATKMINRLAEVKAYISDKEGTNKDKTHAEKVTYYKKQIKKWNE